MSRVQEKFAVFGWAYGDYLGGLGWVGKCMGVRRNTKAGCGRTVAQQSRVSLLWDLSWPVCARAEELSYGIMGHPP